MLSTAKPVSDGLFLGKRTDPSLTLPPTPLTLRLALSVPEAAEGRDGGRRQTRQDDKVEGLSSTC